MRNPRYLALVIVALLLLLVAVSIDSLSTKPESLAETSGIFNRDTLVSLLKELSFAFIIAWLLIVSIDHVSKMADRQTADRLRREIANDVFKGVFSRDLSPEYVDTAISLHLKPSLVRNYVKIDYAFEDLSEEERQKHGPAANELFLLRSRYEYSLTNVTHRPLRHDLCFKTPALPGSLSDFDPIERFDVGETKRKLQDLRKALVATEENSWRSYHASIEFEPESSLYFVVEVLLLKDKSDSHTWASFYPTMKADVSVTTLPNLYCGLLMHSVTPATETHRSNNGLFSRWEIDGPIMTHESIVLSWRDVPDQAGPGLFTSGAG